jgi:hypothetical protein
MKIFNLFRKESTEEKKIIGTPNGGIQFSETDLYYTDIEGENFIDDLKFFRKYKEDLSEKYSIIEIDAFLLITQALFAYHPFDIYKVRDLELNLSEKNVEAYNQEKINLDKIHRLFLFFATTRTHELKNKYQEWMKEYYDKYKKPIFARGERSRILPDGYFIEFVYEKILEWQK